MKSVTAGLKTKYAKGVRMRCEVCGQAFRLQMEPMMVGDNRACKKCHDNYKDQKAAITIMENNQVIPNAATPPKNKYIEISKKYGISIKGVINIARELGVNWTIEELTTMIEAFLND